MWTLVITVWALFVIGVIVFAFLERGKEEKLPYKLEQYFFNKSELAFFYELKKAVPENHHIFSKVRIIDFITPTSRKYKWRNKIWSRHVDFLICDQQLKPVLAIEVDGKSHLSAKRVERDDFINKVFATAGLRLERVPVGSNFSEIATKIFS